MEREFNFGSTPENPFEKNESSEKKEKKTEKKKNFMDEIREKRDAKKVDKPETNKSIDPEKTPSKKELAKEFLDHKAEDLKSEIENHTSLEQAVEAQADLALVEAISEKLDNPEKEVEPAIEAAYQELMEALDDVEEDFAEEDSRLTDNKLSEGTIDEDNEPVDSAVFSIPPVFSPPSTKQGGSNSNSSSRRSTPPPTQPPGRPPVPPIPPAAAFPPPLNNNFNVTPSSNNPEDDQRRRVASKMIVAGAVGYMIGRRGGRKRAEAKARPEIKKRDETIINLKKDVEAKEFKLREAANEKYVASKNIPEKPAVKIEQTVVRTPEHITEVENKTYEKPKPLAKQPKYETRAEQTMPLSPAERERTTNPKIEQVSTTELLLIAEKIIVLDTTVRHLYETNQITRQGLEEIIKEHLKGHDIGPVLDRRLLGKEAIRDRAHEVRHDDPGFTTATDDSQTDNTTPVATQKNKTTTHGQTDWAAPPPLNTPGNTATINRDSVTDVGQKTEAPALKSENKTASIIAIAVIAIVIALFLVRFLLG